MKKFRALLALCLAVLLCTGCGSDPAPETTAPIDTTPIQTEPPETTVPPTEPAGFDNTRFAITLPDGYTESPGEDNRFCFVSPEDDHSSVEVEIIPREEGVLTMSANNYRKRIDTTKQAGSDAIRFKLIDIWSDQVDGWPCVVSEYNLVYEDYITHIFRYEIVCRYVNFIFTFTDGSDDNVWLDRFVDCVRTIGLNPTEGSSGQTYDGLTEYVLGCGLRIFAEAGLTRHGAAGFTECLGSRNTIVLLMADDKQTNHLTQMDLYGYGQLLRSTNDLGEFREDMYGNLYTSFYSASADGTEYFNMIFLKETEDAFWVCQMACTAGMQDQYEPEFPLWASSIQAE